MISNSMLREKKFKFNETIKTVTLEIRKMKWLQ